MSEDVLDLFSPATAAWFRGSFSAPTPAQEGAWRAIGSGRHALVVAPTGSGKTLSAFLSALDRLTSTPPPDDPKRRCRVLYVSPLKALAVDVERNLRSPLVGIGHAAERLGLPRPEVSVAVRSGDTPQDQRRAFARAPSDILITTPESLFLLLTSAARESLTGVETVIIDEIHALAGTKRGAHLALTLERLDALLERPAQRVGLSATVRPIDEVARFLAGGRPVEIVQPPSSKQWDLRVVVPVPDLGALGQPTGDLSGPAAGAEQRASIWPHVEERIVDLVAEHTSTLVFANSRRLAERLTTRLNEQWDQRLAIAADPDAAVPVPPDENGGGRHPSVVGGSSGVSHGAAPILARAHHGSVSKEQRALIEEDLKAGRLPAVVATSSLELGIDMGAIDLVVQVESPPSVASGLQRVGRAGHQVGAVSRGIIFPKFRGDLVQSAVVVENMRAGRIESLHVPANPLDVLAQQVVAMVALDAWTVDDVLALARRTASFAGLSLAVLESVLDMLAGRYPSDEFAELRPRLTWDRVTDTLTGRRAAQRLAVTSGGTIPDRGLFAVFLATGEGPGRRVGELDEEMVYESRVGDLFTLGTSTWRIEDITHDRVLVTPAPGQPGRLPFWKGDSLGRPLELGRAVGAFVRELGELSDAAARDRVGAAGLDAWATDNLLGHLAEQREATGVVPDDRTIVVERFRDELGDWRVVVHSPFGAQVHAPWALAVSARMRERFGVDVQAMHGDDGIVFRLPDVEWDAVGLGWPGDEDLPEAASRRGRPIGAELLELVSLDPDDVRRIVTDEVGGSALFAARFRECAARALLLPRRRPDRRQPLWQQRQRAAQLLEVASGYPSFPIVLEAVREVLQDVFDVPGLVELMRAVRSREVRVLDVESAQPSPFARSLLFGYVAQFLYEGDSPLAERRAAALSLDPALLAELLGGDGLSLRDLLDPEAIARTEAELQRLTPERACRDAEDVIDLLRALGPLTIDEIAARCGDRAERAADWLGEAGREVIPVRVAGAEHWAAVSDAARLRDALGASLPVGLAAVHLEPVTDPLGDLVARYARTHGPFRPQAVASRLGLGVAVVQGALARLVQSGRVVEGEFLPTETGSTEFCDAEVLRSLRRRSLAALRAEVEPVTPRELARFLPAWQGVGSGLRGRDGLLRVIEQLSGAIVPASALETFVLPSRVADYSPGLLDEVLASGEALWRGHGPLGTDDGWVSLHLAETARLTLPPPEPLPEEGPVRAVQALLGGGGAFFFRGLVEALREVGEAAVVDALWSLVWSGRASGDTFAPVRGLLAGGRTAHKAPRVGPRQSRYGARRPGLGAISLGLGAASGSGSGVTGGTTGGSSTGSSTGSVGFGVGRAALTARATPPEVSGRWSLLPEPVTDPTVRALAAAETLLDRHGILTRGAVVAEDVSGGFAAVHRVLTRAEEAGRVRRGYFIEGLGASQFGMTGAIDRLRDASRSAARDRDRTRERPAPLVLAAADPANPYGSALPWPDRAVPDPDDRRGHQPSRKAGALVVIDDGDLVLHVERGGRTILTFTTDETLLDRAARALADTVHSRRLAGLSVERIDGAAALGAAHPLVSALSAAGFITTTRGLRLRR